MIRRLEHTAVSEIKSQQYFPDAHSILKELVENALDACASFVRVTMDTLSITVEDDGDGIQNLASVGQERCTSKLEETYRVLGYRDDSAGESSLSYGFRGQALYALKNLADVVILTKARESCSASAGALCTHASASRDCTEALAFETQAPRSPCALRKNLCTGVVTCSARDYGTTVTVSDIFRSLPVRRKLLNVRRELPRILHLMEAYTLVHNVKVSLLFEGRLLLSRAGCSDILGALRRKHPQETFHERSTDAFTLVIGDSPGKESFVFYRKRPVRNSVLARAVQDAYSLFRKGKALFVLDVKGECDFSLSPDKMEILVGARDHVVCGVRRAVEELFSESYVVHSGGKERDASSFRVPDTPSSTGSTPESEMPAEWCELLGAQHTTLPKEHGQPGSSELLHTEDGQRGETAESRAGRRAAAQKPLLEKNIYSMGLFRAKRARVESESGVPSACTVPDAFETQADSAPLGPVRASSQQAEDVRRTCAFDFFAAHTPPAIHTRIEKGDFSRMSVVGQFNNGFILCTLAEESKTTLLVIDQHASDEIQNFERLQRGVQLKRQLLIDAISPRLSPADAFLVESNADTFRRNGFLLHNNELVTVPVYGDTIFGIEDFYSLVENIKCGRSCFDRLRDIMASKACRASIMIGEALDHRRMRSIVKGLSTLRSPWRCPHGRPVLKVLSVWMHSESGVH